MSSFGKVKMSSFVRYLLGGLYERGAIRDESEGTRSVTHY